jgi:hypothetical protein
MKPLQKIYESIDLNNIINKEHSIFFHKKNLSQIKRKKSNINTETDENLNSAKIRNLNHINDPNGKNKIKN